MSRRYGLRDGTSGARPPRAGAWAAVVCAVVVTLAGCSGTGSGDRAQAPARGPAATAGDQATGAGGGAAASSAPGDAKGKGKGADKAGPSKGSTPAGLHIVRTAELSVRVKDVAKALDAARTAVTDAGGLVSDEQTYAAGGGERSRLVLRVPQEHYQQVLDTLSGGGKLISRSVKAQDVTDQVVDVDSRVRSARASVARVRKLMDEASELSDVVSLEGELSSREAALESLLAQQASLKDRTSLATITLTLSERPTAHTKTAAKDDPGFLDALSGGWHALLAVLRWLALVLGAVLPFLVPLALLVLLWWRLIRPRLARRRPAAPAHLGHPLPRQAPRPGPDPANAAGVGAPPKPSARASAHTSPQPPPPEESATDTADDRKDDAD
ncbi:DUF4349 domain-containing protein [Streptomyces sp. NPDC058045]|uniref:DUF4349 domain-containing protein n=1 Tax=Streptomyces sp. NPDC058045 TaxID=3346311 RepID=UPI0036E4C474